MHLYNNLLLIFSFQYIYFKRIFAKTAISPNKTSAIQFIKTSLAFLSLLLLSSWFSFSSLSCIVLTLITLANSIFGMHNNYIRSSNMARRNIVKKTKKRPTKTNQRNVFARVSFHFCVYSSSFILTLLFGIARQAHLIQSQQSLHKRNELLLFLFSVHQ